MTSRQEARTGELRAKAGTLGPMLGGCLQTKKNRVANKDGSTHTSPEHCQFQYRGADGRQHWKNGYYIGSGHVEAAVRVLIVRRCRRAGRHWRHTNAVSMAAIHARYRSHQKDA